MRCLYNNTNELRLRAKPLYFTLRASAGFTLIPQKELLPYQLAGIFFALLRFGRPAVLLSAGSVLLA